MKSIVTAALVIVVEAGFIASVAVLPSRPEPAPQRTELVARQAPAAAAAPASRS